MSACALENSHEYVRVAIKQIMTRAPDKCEKNLLIYAIQIFSTFNYHQQHSISFFWLEIHACKSQSQILKILFMKLIANSHVN